MALRRLGLNSALIWWLGSQLVWAAAPTRTYSYVSGQVINPTQVTTNEDNIYSYLQSGVDTYVAGSIANASIADNTIATGKILDGTILNADVSTSAAITYGKLSFSDNIVAGDIAAGAVGASEIASGAVDVVDMATTGTAADDKAFVADSASAGTWRTITNCTDTGGNHLNYTQSTNAFSCGTTSGGGKYLYIGSNSVNRTATFFLTPGGGANATESSANLVFAPETCTASAMYAAVGVAPGSGTSWTVCVNINQSPLTEPCCTISNTATSCSETVSTGTVTGGQLINWEWTSSGAVAGTDGQGAAFICTP